MYFKPRLRVSITSVLAICGMAQLLVLAGGRASATGINQTLAEFNGPENPLGSIFPQPPIVVGTFSSIPNNEVLVLGEIRGTFGNSMNSSTAGVDLFLGDGGDSGNDVLVAQCVKNTSCYFEFIDSWSHAFSPADIATLSAIPGPLTLTAIQTSETIIRLGPTTLVGTSLPIPEPQTLTLVGIILPCLIRRTRGWYPTTHYHAMR